MSSTNMLPPKLSVISSGNTALLEEPKVAAARRESRALSSFCLQGLLLLSGFCGISYEILYARMMGNLIGDQFAVSASILLSFMLGIGIGALYAHHLWRFLWLVE